MCPFLKKMTLGLGVVGGHRGRARTGRAGAEFPTGRSSKPTEPPSHSALPS